jgi:hypothetical protein
VTPDAYASHAGVRLTGLTSATVGISTCTGHPALAAYSFSIALIYTLLIGCAAITALYTQDSDRRRVAVKVLKILTGTDFSLAMTEPSHKGAAVAGANLHDQVTLKWGQAQQDRTGTLVALWIGVVTCVGVFVAAAALAHGSVMIGGMTFSAAATVITLVWLFRIIRAKPGRHN